MSSISQNNSNALPPDVILETLPYLSTEDIKNLSLTNKYYHKLLDYKNSDTLWKELYHKIYGSPYTNVEPFQGRGSDTFKSCSEQIISNLTLTNSWAERYRLRTETAKLLTWGSIKQGRLGYSASSNPFINPLTNNFAHRLENTDDDSSPYNYNPVRMAICLPTQVPWDSNSDNIRNNNDSIVSVTGGGFSFQILTKSGKIFSTGTSFTGGIRGPGPREGQSDYNQFRELAHLLELSFSHLTNPSIPHHGATPINIHRTVSDQQNLTIGVPIIGSPHANVYQNLEALNKEIRETAPGNEYLTRMFPRESLPLYNMNEDNILQFDKQLLDSVKFSAVTSGRTHFLALSTEGNIYVWDSPESNDGIRIKFRDLPTSSVDPILKIACGWNFNCIYQYNVGLVVWRERDPLKSGETSSYALYEVIGGTSQSNGAAKIIDFTCLSDKVVFYIDEAGEFLYRYSNKVTEKIKTPIKQKISKLVSCFNSIILFTVDHCYSFKLKDNQIELETIKELKVDEGNDDHIVSLSSGDYHTLILTKKGQIYVSGSESQMCGCLGLGVYEDQPWGHLEGRNNVIVETPRKIDIGEGNICVGIAAGGWQSSAIIVRRS
ncbi:similar to Saccharomyces cerevisiae YBR280C SAF1 F-Box protein involved in proteasome- dependent degradation of Aah1p during entry of cells into quiescence [Maudiozyma barnettii]|uniref:Similar to Saccharomyces cerevisiae YBR280C SAF1 F-Box protein involved in proteasome- dependent degradation of Aah1p during entry of cells into quiescence n=1 Tax=Maudiozyma barnettii TaxID=61262 RepID=A0A8H2VFK6_9SACH|nr:SCF ubiquitin ligase complex subunit SAF1 [Kazachstania barnettii]CAB4254560.1 similar to Saccharomyces cerevisiae YBR280C SAF1 F-Box protein involved in proteasome- dependent degradation of Aah1p during entry of cells into quiescence [Kazachstania barnettii]CAD1782602.1 similar to Saccharomyces cerevisiae YBR280C SAF1 F-Box protein involved in proteasome- dependent degradation of Aah1p during entry of cells into quiescence [Kazachstania barnettii]